MTHYSCKKGPSYALTLLEYNIPSKKDQAMTHYSCKKGPGYVLILLKYKPPQERTKPQHTTHSKKDQATH